MVPLHYFSLRTPEAMLCAGMPSMSKQKTSTKFTDYTRTVQISELSCGGHYLYKFVCIVCNQNLLSLTTSAITFNNHGMRSLASTVPSAPSLQTLNELGL